MADTWDMAKDAWRSRLSAAIEQSGKSYRSISLAAGAGAGYVHSLFADGKVPTIEKLLDVCEVIGVSPSYILYGLDVMPEDAEIISAMRADPVTRDAILAILRARKVSQ
jgi:lambda repressor-like predicted transcriptional regulator